MLRNDDTMSWVALTGPAGSAVLLFVLPDADSAWLTRMVAMRWREATPGWNWSLMTVGAETDSAVAVVVDPAFAVPAWELPGLEAQRRGGAPPSVPLPTRQRLLQLGWQSLPFGAMQGDIDPDPEREVIAVLGANEAGVLGLGFGVTETTDGLISPALVRRFEPQGIELAIHGSLVAIMQSFPDAAADHPTADEVLAAGRRLAAAATAFWAPPALSEVPAPSFPGPAPASMWQLVEQIPPACAALRVAELEDLDAAELVFVENVRVSLPEGADDGYQAVQILGARLQAQRGSGYEPVLRSGTTAERLSPWWLTTKSMCWDGASGRVALAGHLNHAALDLPAALDLGDADGRNAFGWGEEEVPAGLAWQWSSLYVGSTRTGVLVPWAVGPDTLSVDLRPADGLIATFEMWDGRLGSVSTFDGSGTRRLLTYVQGVTGGERVRFSPDGQWLLLDNGTRSVLVEVTSGRWRAAPVANADWWPERPNSLLTVENSDECCIPRVYDLARDEVVAWFPPLRIGAETDTAPELWHCWSPVCSADGSEILVESRAGITPAYQNAHGSRTRIARVALATGVGQLLTTMFVDDEQLLERAQSEARWPNRRPARPPDRPAAGIDYSHPRRGKRAGPADPSDRIDYTHPRRQRTAAPPHVQGNGESMAGALSEPLLAPTPSADRSLLARNAKQLAAFALQAARRQLDNSRPGNAGVTLIPEIVAALTAYQAAGDQEGWQAFIAKVHDASGFVQQQLAQSDVNRHNSPDAAWPFLLHAVIALGRDRPEEIDSRGLAWHCLSASGGTSS